MCQVYNKRKARPGKKKTIFAFGWDELLRVADCDVKIKFEFGKQRGRRRILHHEQYWEPVNFPYRLPAPRHVNGTPIPFIFQSDAPAPGWV